MEREAPASTPPQPASQAQTEQPSFGEPQQASPEEQKAYDTFVGQALNLIYDKRTLPQLLAMMKEDPIEGLASATAAVVSRIGMAGEEAGEQFSSEVVLHAATEIFEDLANLATEAGIKDFAADPDAMEGAYFRALDEFRVQLQEAGRIDPEKAKQEMASIQEADERGELEAMLRSFAERDDKEGVRAPKPGGDKPKPRGLGVAMEAA
ncbi:MAG: hypothetical protein K5872_22335 [Rhizobiaceae bacterium]|nr:hypothetical protein [Rhizobiaceae bacterium]MCV0408960.1 hypothetical protein [Rhizobiaceae bacterium]